MNIDIVIPSSSSSNIDDNVSQNANAAANAIQLLSTNNTMKKLLHQMTTINDLQCKDINDILFENNRLKMAIKERDAKIAQIDDNFSKPKNAFEKMKCAFETMQIACKQMAEKVKKMQYEKEMKEKTHNDLRQNMQSCLDAAEQQRRQQQEPMIIDASEPLFNTQQVIESTFAEAKQIAKAANAIVAASTTTTTAAALPDAQK